MWPLQEVSLLDYLVNNGLNLGPMGRRYEPGDVIEENDLYDLVKYKYARENLVDRGHISGIDEDVPAGEDDDSEGDA